MKTNRVKFALAALAVISIVAGQAFSSPQQVSTQNTQSGGIISIAGGMDRLAVLTHLLALTTSQQEQVKAMLDEEEALSKPLAGQLQQAADALRSAEKAMPDNPDIEPLATRLAGISGQIVAADAKAESQIYALLTETQKQKLDQLPHPFFVPSGLLLPPGPILATSTTSSGH